MGAAVEEHASRTELMGILTTVEVGKLRPDEACPSCGEALCRARVRRRYKALHVATIWREELIGYRCSGCEGSFLAQTGLMRWLDVATQMFLTGLIASLTLFPALWWGGWMMTRETPVEQDELMFLGGALVVCAALLFLPARSLLRRWRVARAGGLTPMKADFIGAL